MDGLESVRVKKPNERQWGPDGGWCTPGFLTALSRVLDGVTPMSSLGVRGCIREREREEEVDPRRVILVAVCLSSVPLSEANWICLLYLWAL